MAPFYGWGSTASRLQNNFGEVVYFLPQSSQKVLVLIWWTLEGWKAESTLEMPSGSEQVAPRLGIQHLNQLGHHSVSPSLHGAWKTEFFVILDSFPPFYTLTTQKIKMLQKWKKQLKISSF